MGECSAARNPTRPAHAGYAVAMDLSWLDAIGGPRVAAALVVGVAVLAVIPRLLRKEPTSHFERRRCASCGWEGGVSPYKPRCPKCATPL